MLHKILSYLSLMFTYFQLNLRSQLEYRGAFIAQVVGMFINDTIWVVFWYFFFSRFKVINGWGPNDTLMLWAVAAIGIGISVFFFANAYYIATIIIRGQLDSWLLYPRQVLSHLILERMNASALGDILFGFTAFLMFAHPSWQQILTLIAVSIPAAITFTSIRILSGSFGFFIGNAEMLSRHWEDALITFSLYPLGLFSDRTRLILFTIIPAAFISHVPVEAIRHLSLQLVLVCWLSSLAILATAVAVFYFGLRRYESGNLMGMRG